MDKNSGAIAISNRGQNPSYLIILPATRINTKTIVPQNNEIFIIKLYMSF